MAFFMNSKKFPFSAALLKSIEKTTPTPLNFFLRVGSPQAGQSVSVGSDIDWTISWFVSQDEQAYSYVGTWTSGRCGQRGLALSACECQLCPLAGGSVQSVPSGRRMAP